MPKARRLRIWGNVFLLIGIAGLVWTFGPLLVEELRFRLGTEQNLLSLDSEYRVTIPSLKIQAPVIINIDPFNRKEYTEALTRGVAQAKETALPNEPGTHYLFAHSSDAPWRLSRYNTAFFRLNRIKQGDPIYLDYEGTRHIFVVRETKTVWPSETHYLTDTTLNQLILQTCTPIGTDLQRFLVFADPI